MRMNAILAVTLGLCALPAFADTLHMRPIPVVDQYGFDKPVAAGTILVPDGWTGEGGIVWRLDPCTQSHFGAALTVASPDNSQFLAVLDLPGWHYSSNPQPAIPGAPECKQEPYAAIDAFFDGMIPALFPGGQIIDRRPRPDVVQEAEAAGWIVAPPPSQVQGTQQTLNAEAGDVLVSFQSQGADYRAQMVCLVVQRGFVIDGQGYHHEETYGTPYCVLQSAPNGKVDFGLTEVFRKSYKPSADWANKIAQFSQNIADINAKGVADRFKITTQATAETNQMITDIYASNQASVDHNSREASEGILGVETYADPVYGGTVQLDSNYGQAWQLNDGSYVLSNDANFDPNRDMGISATQLQVAQ